MVLRRLAGCLGLGVLGAFSIAACAPIETGGTAIDVGGGIRVHAPLQSFKERRDAGLVRQAFDYSCGAAALATLLTYGLGDPTSEADVIAEILQTIGHDEEELRRKEGFSLLDMQRIAQARGYRAQGFRIAPEFVGQLQGPVIVFIRPRGYEHFAVLKGVQRDRVHLADPSLGNVRRAWYDFLEMWLGEDGRGIIFVVEPEDGARPASLLEVRAPDLPRPELMSVRQLLEIGPRAGGVS
jgi:uncharacterized protein